MYGRPLQKLKMKTLSHEECNRLNPNLIHAEGHICAIDLNVGGTGTCYVSTLIAVCQQICECNFAFTPFNVP